MLAMSTVTSTELQVLRFSKIVLEALILIAYHLNEF
jgi:hypothetical protein